MRDRPTSGPARLGWTLATSALLALGPIGCGGSAPPTGTASQISPETVKANTNMLDYMKNQKKK